MIRSCGHLLPDPHNNITLTLRCREAASKGWLQLKQMLRGSRCSHLSMRDYKKPFIFRTCLIDVAILSTISVSSASVEL